MPLYNLHNLKRNSLEQTISGLGVLMMSQGENMFLISYFDAVN